MTAVELINEAEEIGLELSVTVDGMIEVSPGENCPKEFADKLKTHKPLILDYANSRPHRGFMTIPPPYLPLNPVQPRPSESEWNRMKDYMIRQGCRKLGPLKKWLTIRELEYHNGPGKKWNDQDRTYATARDAACWQLARSEKEVLFFLKTSEEIATSKWPS